MTINTDFSSAGMQCVARLAAVRGQRPSISLLQRTLHIGYHAAIRLFGQLEQSGFADRNGDGQWQWTPAFAAGLQADGSTVGKEADAEIQVLDIGQYTHSVLRLSAYLHAVAEEGACGHARVVSLLKPRINVGDIEIRDVFHQIYRIEKPSCTDAAILMHRWFVRHAGVRTATDHIETRLAEYAAATNRPWREVSDRERRIARAVHRLAACLQDAVATESEPDFSPHGGIDARVFQYFVPKSYLLHPASRPTKGFCEYVVPCSYLVRESLRFFRQGWQTDEVASFIRRCLAIVAISPEDRKALESSALANEMPEGWCPQHGDIYARLHPAGIAFSKP
jgi:hypothetical protein